MQRLVALIRPAVVAAGIALAGCGGGGSDTPASPTVPQRAFFQVVPNASGQVCASPLAPDFATRIRLDMRINEINGVGANWNFARLSIYEIRTEIERSEVTAADLAAQVGSNRVEANGSIDAILAFDFNTPSERIDAIGLVFDLTDDAGYHVTPNIPQIDIEFVDTCSS